MDVTFVLIGWHSTQLGFILENIDAIPSVSGSAVSKKEFIFGSERKSFIGAPSYVRLISYNSMISICYPIKFSELKIVMTLLFSRLMQLIYTNCLTQTVCRKYDRTVWRPYLHNFKQIIEFINFCNSPLWSILKSFNCQAFTTLNPHK